MQDLSLFFQAEATDDDLFPFSSLMATQEATSQEDLFDPEKDYEVPADEGQNAFRRRAFSRKQSTTQDTPTKKATPKKDAEEDGNAVKKGSKVAKKVPKNSADNKTPKKVKVKKDDDKVKNGKT